MYIAIVFEQTIFYIKNDQVFEVHSIDTLKDKIWYVFYVTIHPQLHQIPARRLNKLILPEGNYTCGNYTIHSTNIANYQNISIAPLNSNNISVFEYLHKYIQTHYLSSEITLSVVYNNLYIYRWYFTIICSSICILYNMRFLIMRPKYTTNDQILKQIQNALKI